MTSLSNVKFRIETGCGAIHGNFSEDEKGELVHVHFEIGKSGNCYNTRFGTMTHLVNLLLEQGMKIDKIRHAFDGRTCSNSKINYDVKGGEEKVSSCDDGVSKLIDKYLIYKKQLEVVSS